MDTKITTCAVLCIILYLLEKCDASKPKMLKKKFTPNKSSVCSSYGICEHPPSYPMKAINKMLSSKKNKKKFAHMSGTVIEPTKDIHSIKTRGPVDIDMNMCRTIKKSWIPRDALDAKMNRKFIANTDTFQQIVNVELCQSPNESCNGNGYWPDDITTFCKQAYSTVRLVAVDSSTGKLQYGYFPVPSNCICSCKKTSIPDYPLND